MVDVRRPDLVDSHSHDHAIKYFRGHPVKQFLRALRQTKRKLTELDHHLDFLTGNGDPGDGKLAAWTHYQPNPKHPDFISGLSSPGEILDKDLNFVQACLDIVKKRTHKEYNPTPSISPRAAKKQTVTADSLCLSPHPQLLPSVQSRIHKAPSVISSSEYRHNKALLPPTVVRDKMESIEIDRRTL